MNVIPDSPDGPRCHRVLDKHLNRCYRPLGHIGVCNKMSLRADSDCNVWCKLCGLGPRKQLHIHVIKAHEGVAEYRKRFGRDSLASESSRFNSTAIWNDRVDDGIIRPRTKTKTCKWGHRWTVQNTIIHLRTVNGHVYEIRFCRQCAAERHKRRHPRPGMRRCKWHKCRKLFQPTRTNNIYCSKNCKKRASDPKPPTFRMRRCALPGCDNTFKPRMSTQRYCSEKHQRRAAHKRKTKRK